MMARPTLTIEVLQSQHDASYYALSIDDVRYGPDAGPWTVIRTFKVDARRVAEQALFKIEESSDGEEQK